MKEFLAALVLVGIIAYFWFTAASPEDSELREKRRSAAPTVVAPAQTSTATVSSIGAPPNTDGSLASRWKTGPNGQIGLTATVPDRWKLGPNPQTDLTATIPDRWKSGPNAQTGLTGTPPDRWKPFPK
jgi:hypothetical protein